MVALMTELLCLEPNDRVLEIGTGSGYQTAVLLQLRRTSIQLSAFPVWRNRPNVYCEHSDMRL